MPQLDPLGFEVRHLFTLMGMNTNIEMSKLGHFWIQNLVPIHSC